MGTTENIEAKLDLILKNQELILAKLNQDPISANRDQNRISAKQDLPQVTPLVFIEPEQPISAPPPEKQDEFVDIRDFGIHSIDQHIEGLNYQGPYMPGNIKPKIDGYWSFFDGVPKILRIKNGLENIIDVDYVGKPDFLALDLSKKKIWIEGTYIQLQGAGLNTFWYQKTKSISGTGKLIGVNNENAERFNRITPNISGITLENIIIDNVLEEDKDQEVSNLTINLSSMEVSRNVITGTNAKSRIRIDNLNINSDAVLRAGVFIDQSKSVLINGGEIKAKYADNGVRVSRVDSFCEITNLTTGKGFNTGIQASANREKLSVGFKFNKNKIVNVLEEGLGFDSYANNLNLIPVIAKSRVISVNGKSSKLGDLIFLESTPQGFKHKVVGPTELLDPKDCLLIDESNYKVHKIEGYHVEGNNFVLVLDQEIAIGSDVALVTGFYNCEIADNIAEGEIPQSNTQPGHAISLWGGGYFNRIFNNTINGGRSGLSFASLGGFGLTDPDFFCHAIGNLIEGNRFNKVEFPFRITSEYSTKKGHSNKFIFNYVDQGEFLINNQINFELRDNEFRVAKGLIENVSGIVEGNKLIDTRIIVKNCPDLRIGNNELIGSSQIIRE